MSDNQAPATIDAVITWVDGKDPHHIKKQRQIINFCDQRLQSEVSSALNSMDEITYCVESIIHYAPFIRTIFIVTDDQIPDIYYKYPDRIRIVDHREIFRDYEQFLPTINIFSIECLLYRIHDLSENFIYFNDDFFLIKPTHPQDWFVNGLPVIRGRWETPPDKIWYKRLATFFGIKSKVRAGFRRIQAQAARIAGFESKFFRCYHTPRALRKSTFTNFFADNLELLVSQIQHRRRHASQFNPYSLAWHLEIRNNTAYVLPVAGVKELHHLQYKSVSQVEQSLLEAESDDGILSVNIQSLNLAFPNEQNFIINWLKRIGRRNRGKNQRSEFAMMMISFFIMCIFCL